MRQSAITGYSRSEIESKIDDIIRTGKKFTPINLIMPVNGASKYSYRDFQVREWHYNDQVRYDTGVEIDE